MLFVITACDRPSAPDLRRQVRLALLECLEGTSAQIKTGGPPLKENEQPMGGMLIVEADDRTGDPYREGGLFEHVEIRPWPALGARAG